MFEVKYAIFSTQAGFVALVCAEDRLVRVFLPVASRVSAVSKVGIFCPSAREEQSIFPDLQEKIVRYFEGEYVVFREDAASALAGYSEIAGREDISSRLPDMVHMTPFRKDILLACNRVNYGRTVSYGELARLAGRPKAARAVGNALADNPFPIVVPCHRVIRSNGSPGGFMHNQPGAQDLKCRMLQLEKR
ncbi:methylated-DNA--[protein]-cysteine S-methyltransferase [Anaerohalosphaera lusitana]|nr:MGMT family protein [Anaerohalosphaera lusitana]